jgi:hypothetical protein
MASTASGVEDRNVSIGRVLSRAFATMGSNPLTVFGISFVFGALPRVALNYLAQTLGYSQQNYLSGAITPLFYFSIAAGITLFSIFSSMLTQGALVRATIAHSEGREASFGESAMAGLRVVLPLLLLGILFSLGLMLGFVLLIVPGIFLYLMWAVAAPALVEERTGVFGAFNRSSYLTKGARWHILALGLVMVLIYLIFSAVIGATLVLTFGVQGMVAGIQHGLPLGYLLVSGILATILTAIITTIQTSLYVELRNWKDGPASEKLADIFG